MTIKKKKVDPLFFEEASPFQAFADGNAVTKLSALVFGLGNFVHGQILRGLFFLMIEIGIIFFMIRTGFHSLAGLSHLGTRLQGQVFDESLQIYVTQDGDNSMLFLLYGVIAIFVILAFLVFMAFSVKSAYCTEQRIRQGLRLPNMKEDLLSFRQNNLHIAFLTLPIIGIVLFTILPIFFMILIAFTNFDANHQPPGNLFTWVGLANFASLFARGGTLASTFWPVLGWTLIWAVLATVSNYVLGMILAIVINRNGTKFKTGWRFFFFLSMAIPQFVSLLTMRNLFNQMGAINLLLESIFGIQAIPFLLTPNLARMTVLLVNIWIGVPFTMLIVTGILQNIPAELYESANLDGAGPGTTFFKITLPYMLFITTPYLITQFTGNINNFNVIYLLTQGGPASLDYFQAGKTDLLVTWLYNMAMTKHNYNLASVVGIMIFIILATVSLITYRNTAAFKDEGAFQ